MDTIKEIIKRKENGIDCTEIESAEIKGFIKESFKLALMFHLMKNLIDYDSLNKVHDLFPIEFGEAIDEIEKSNK